VQIVGYFFIIPCNNSYYSKIASLLHNVFILKQLCFKQPLKYILVIRSPTCFGQHWPSSGSTYNYMVKLPKELIFVKLHNRDASMPVVGYVMPGGASHYCSAVSLVSVKVNRSNLIYSLSPTLVRQLNSSATHHRAWHNLQRACWHLCCATLQKLILSVTSPCNCMYSLMMVSADRNMLEIW